MKTIFLLGALALAGTGTALAQQGDAATARSPQQTAAMKADITHVETLITKINRTYHTDFAIAPRREHEAMMHMARAEMEMAKAMMDEQINFNPSPLGGFPGGS
ncbi:MAG: hypothetical protein B7Z59_01390 [Acidiphilium sp. 37-67-22]|uniref:hypothetical protein n=1 Tax=unclassified Acidiphilium TaxID=2617493 RepID=UPI000BCAC086|nr:MULTISPECIES: hypothetical protein [unclassified Acidiphilium]OYV87300.1 MAG: hypothetical protein B7Z64_01765 [Acidiphilium sp. 21-68-69]OYW12423.1 MAG: hypothetical protein B7Z59_01390 [Acidiphilium sp. 37-67-22]OYV57557.1 MAG: hypothetical protein B7Z76_00980 [Acidiphilium sp. 20-67-58]HQT59762.1 hypothetical protein [Acidiphilium sp.]HQU11379.1 hypothetical protein [Acidiphilium sp.]